MNPAPDLCYYRNATSQIQTIRIDRTLEKVMFPGDRILFHAALEATLEIYSSTPNGFVQIDCISCLQLQVVES
ncbi:MAG: DUF1830 domain-containing protein [Leptolyngbyaceae cyanobacterium SM1_3_5]|nr:DUF1830 domain-containing protein [Leptolyngbyaceae cyanobacterium SM1_3_5]